MGGLKSLMCIFILYFLCCLTTCAQIDSPLNINQESLDSLGMEILSEGSIMGFSVAITSGKRVLYNSGFGHIDVEKTQPVTNETRFDIASVSKLVGVTVIMKLIEEGRLSLDTSLEQLMPEFPEEALAEKIKLRHMLSHTSGLMDYALEMDRVFMENGVLPTKKDLLAFFKGKDLRFEPGTNYQYCNSGFMLMAFIAENITGRPWQQLIEDYINQRSNLDFQLLKYAVERPETSPIFNYGKERFDKVPTWSYVMGDGGLTTTTEMLALYPQFWSKGKIIEPSAYEKMVKPTELSNSLSTGYGYGVRNGEFLGERIIGHTGGWKTTYAIMAFFPDRNVTFAGLMNTDGTPLDMNQIFTKYMSVVLGRKIPDYSSGFKEITNLYQYVGDYHGFDTEFDHQGKTVTVNLQDGQLQYCINANCEKLWPMGKNKFWLKSFPYDFIEFQTNDQGKALAIKEYYYGFFQVLRKRVIE